MKEKVLIQLIKELAIENPNDSDLGKKVRIVLNKLKDL